MCVPLPFFAKTASLLAVLQQWPEVPWAATAALAPERFAIPHGRVHGAPTGGFHPHPAGMMRPSTMKVELQVVGGGDLQVKLLLLSTALLLKGSALPLPFSSKTLPFAGGGLAGAPQQQPAGCSRLGAHRGPPGQEAPRCSTARDPFSREPWCLLADAAAAQRQAAAAAPQRRGL